jgi:hypothetical protein
VNMLRTRHRLTLCKGGQEAFVTERHSPPQHDAIPRCSIVDTLLHHPQYLLDTGSIRAAHRLMATVHVFEGAQTGEFGEVGLMWHGDRRGGDHLDVMLSSIDCTLISPFKAHQALLQTLLQRLDHGVCLIHRAVEARQPLVLLDLRFQDSMLVDDLVDLALKGLQSTRSFLILG